MKTKIALFLFALGLGSSTVYATTPQYECLKQCTNSYRECLGRNPTPSRAELCSQLRADCNVECADL